MSNLNLKKTWVTWFPQEVFLKNIENNKITLFDFYKIKQEDFYVKNHENNIQTESKIDEKKIEIYEKAFKKGFLEGQLAHDIITQKLNNLCLSFENDISNFEHQLYSELLKIVLKISSYIIGKKIDVDQSMLINYIQKIINEHGSFLKNPKLIVHPDNKILIENTFKQFIKNYHWRFEYDNSIDLNSCKVTSENSYIDATVNARWQELYRLIFSEEY